MESLVLNHSSRDLQILIAESSGSAVLALLVRLLSNPSIWSDVHRPKSILHNIVSSVLEIDQTVPNNDMKLPSDNVFYAMAGDRAGSFFLEALLECCDLQLFVSVVTTAICCEVEVEMGVETSSSRVLEYAEDKAGNFVLQAILRRIRSELSSPIDENVKVREKVVEVAVKIMNELFSQEVMKSLCANRSGVVMRLLEVCEVLPIDKEEWGGKFGMAVINTWIGRGGDVTAEDLVPVVEAKFSCSNNDDDNKNNRSEKKKEDPSLSSDYDSSQLQSAKLFGLLLMSSSPEVSRLAAKTLSLLSLNTLKTVCTSGQLSKAIVDVFFEKYKGSNEFRALGVSLVSIGTDLGKHFVGQHVVRKSFESCDLRGREKWAMTLSADLAGLSVNKEGRASLQLVNAELYSKDPTEWRTAAKKMIKAANLLAELDNNNSNNNNNNTSIRFNKVTCLKVEAQKAGQMNVIDIFSRGEQLHQSNSQVEQTT